MEQAPAHYFVHYSFSLNFTKFLRVLNSSCSSKFDHSAIFDFVLKGCVWSFCARANPRILTSPVYRLGKRLNVGDENLELPLQARLEHAVMVLDNENSF